MTYDASECTWMHLEGGCGWVRSGVVGCGWVWKLGAPQNRMVFVFF